MPKTQLDILRNLSRDLDVVLLDYETNPDIENLTKPLSHASLIAKMGQKRMVAPTDKIIVELLDHHWSAWFEPRPEVAFGGGTAAAAASRLLEAHGINPAWAQPVGAGRIVTIGAS